MVLSNLIAIFQGKFAVTSVIKIYIKFFKLWLHPAYDHGYNPSISFKIRQYQAETNIFPGNNNPISVKPAVVLGSAFPKKSSIFLVSNLITTD